MFERSEQPRVRQFKPHCLPDSLDDLAGPHQGSVFLPMNLYWARPGGTTVDLGTVESRGRAYVAAMEEGTVHDICRIVNRDHLINDWPDLFWSLALRQVWENRFPELAEIGKSQFWSD
ncbi:hypothetical protein [Corynebacterium variabile]|uniref:hypothetical protein n=1 Tax=Corynebacterium variabile TaxID=1727 RepID=UPI003FD56C76